MRIRNMGLVLWISVGMLAGCQSEGMKFQVGEQRVPEQVGLQIDWIRDLGRDGILQTQPQNIGRFHREQGELDFRLIRVMNRTAETREIYPSLQLIGKDPALVLNQLYYGSCRRDLASCELAPVPANELFEHLSNYHSEYELIGAELTFDSGGKVEIPINPGNDFPRAIVIRPGESGFLSLRLRLETAFPIISSPQTVTGFPAGGAFVPPELYRGPVDGLLRSERLVGISGVVRPEVTFLARNPTTDELNPLYLGTLSPSFTLFAEEAARLTFDFPPPKIAREINALAEQI